jgi:broad specificity phosphatase PhoE
MGLTDLGRRQVAALAARWRRTRVRPDILLSSPVRRATETANLLAADLGSLKATTDCSLCEIHFGVADGLSWEEHAERYGAFDLPSQPRRPFAQGGECWADVQCRVRECLETYAKRYSGQSVAIVTHAGFIVVSILEFLRVEGSTVNRAYLDPWFTSMTRWDVTDGRWTLVSFNDTQHLEDMPELCAE